MEIKPNCYHYILIDEPLTCLTSELKRVLSDRSETTVGSRLIAMFITQETDQAVFQDPYN